MKAKLTFTLPDERKDFICAAKAIDLALALWDIDNYLRGQVKYNEDENENRYAEKIREKYFEILSKYNINLDEIIE